MALVWAACRLYKWPVQLIKSHSNVVRSSKQAIIRHLNNLSDTCKNSSSQIVVFVNIVYNSHRKNKIKIYLVEP